MAAKKPDTKKESIREQMLIALLPQVRIDYARSDAQKAADAVDEIMEVWGIK